VALQGFVLQNPGKLGAITSIFSAVDYSKSGTCDVVVGRDDGSLEVRHRWPALSARCAPTWLALLSARAGFIMLSSRQDSTRQTMLCQDRWMAWQH
jgi:hypothetical protein